MPPSAGGFSSSTGSLTLQRGRALCAALLLSLGCSAEQVQTPAPATPPAIEAIEPTLAAVVTSEVRVAASPDAAAAGRDWLRKLDVRSRSMQTLTAKLRYVTVQGLLGDEQVRFGQLLYAAPTDALPERFAAVLDKQVVDGNQTAIDRRFVFDGRWLLDLDGQERTAARRELANDAGSLDESLLPVPLRVDAEAIERRYDVSLITDEPVDNNDPAAALLNNAVHLRLVSKTAGPRIDLWFDRATLLPLRGESRQRDEDIVRVDVVQPTENAPLPDDAFNTTLPTTPGWDTQIVPLQ